MSDLEQRARQLLRDWQTLRRDLEEIRRRRRLGVFYSKQMEGIEAKIAAARQLARIIEGHLVFEDEVPERTRNVGESYLVSPNDRRSFRSRIQLLREEDTSEESPPAGSDQ